jgi:fatty-acyl-CoA synthase
MRAPDWIGYHRSVYPDAKAQLDLASGRSLSYQQLDTRVGQVAAYLQQLGIGRGDRVAFLALNSTDISDLVFACWRLGASALALNFRLTAPELAFIVEDAAPRAILVDTALAELAADLKAETRIEHWIQTDGRGGHSPFEDALAGQTPRFAPEIGNLLSDEAMLMYSSGTTGKPKGVIITHEMMTFAGINAQTGFDMNRSTVSLAAMPLFHIGGLVMVTNAIYAGGMAVVQRAFEPGQTLATFNDPELGVTSFLGVPAMYNAMKAHPDVETTDFSRMVTMLAGAETVPASLVEWWMERGIYIQEGYGMTETAASSCALPKACVATKVGSAGKPLMHSEIRIVREDGSTADPDELGEIWMRGPTVTPGYWNRPEANQESFVDGWFRSGDIGCRDPDGFIYIEDRIKDMYISGGENVYPAEVENVLYAFDQVAEAAIIGVPDPQWGETGCAVIVLKDGADLELGEIHEACSRSLAKFKWPRHLTVVEALPRNATGKVLKFELRKSIPETLGL